MKVSTRGRYALRLLVYLARIEEAEKEKTKTQEKASKTKQTVAAKRGKKESVWTSVKTVSEHEGISVKYLEQIVSSLTKAKLLKSRRGPQGGYALVKAPKDYTVGEILRAIEGSLTPVSCLEDGRKGCRFADVCSTLDFWMGLDKVITDYVNSYSLQDLVDSKERKKQAFLERTHIEIA